MSIKNGDRVAVDYEGRYENGEVFDSSTHGDHSHALVFTVGKGEVIPGFESAVIGMSQGQSKEVTILPEQAYGPRRAELAQDVPRKEINLPNGDKPREGMTLVMHTPDGHQLPVQITKVSDETVTLDLNHPLAGKTLIFKITIAGINDSIKEDKHHSH